MKQVQMGALRISNILRGSGILFLMIIVTMISNLGCGKRRPPIAPKKKAVERVEISSLQRGSEISITWRYNPTPVSDASIGAVVRADIYRLVLKGDSRESISDDEFTERSSIIGSVEYDAKGGTPEPVSYKDDLDLSKGSLRVLYAVRLVAKSGERLPFSKIVRLNVTSKVSRPIELLSATPNQDAVTVTWKPSDANLDGTQPANLLGYNLYRIEGQNGAVLINKSPVADDRYSDGTFKFGSAYKYFVRAVHSTDAGLTESDPSNQISLTPVDVFPPAPPSAITIAASPKAISIFFAFNQESDIAGYRIFRSEDGELDKSKWLELSKSPIKTTTFQDESVTTGKTYFYFILAVDSVGNLSDPSEVVSETVPN